MLIGKKLSSGKYEVLEHLNHGAHGDLYVCLNTDLKMRQAVKVLKKDLHESMFFREVGVLLNLNHQKICPIRDYFVEKDVGNCIVIDLLSGKDLGQLISLHGTFKSKHVFSLIKNVAEVLVYIHGKKILHRDVKPSNIFITSDNEVKILDFGISKNFLKIDTSVTQNWVTPDYSCPDLWQAKGYNSERYDQVHDIFSLGAIAYEMIFGEKIIEWGATGTPKINANANKNISKLPSLEKKIISAMLGINNEERYQTSKDLFQELGKFGDVIEIGKSKSRKVSSTIKGNEVKGPSLKPSRNWKKTRYAFLLVASIFFATNLQHGNQYFKKSAKRDVSSIAVSSLEQPPENQNDVKSEILIDPIDNEEEVSSRSLQINENAKNDYIGSSIDCDHPAEALQVYFRAFNLRDPDKIGAFYASHLDQAFSKPNRIKDELIAELIDDFKNYESYESEIDWSSLQVEKRSSDCRIQLNQIIHITFSDGVRRSTPVKSVILLNNKGKIKYFRDWVRNK